MQGVQSCLAKLIIILEYLISNLNMSISIEVVHLLNFQLHIKPSYCCLNLVHLFVRKVLLVKKLEMEETKTAQFSTFKTDTIKVGLVFWISNFFITETALANKWMRKKIHSYSNSASK